MSVIRNALFGCAMTFASAVAPIGAAEATPLVVPALQVEPAGAVTQAQSFCFGYHGGSEGRYPRPRYGYRDHYRPRYYDDWQYQRPRYQRPRYERPRYQYGGRSAHARWCSSRYRTYDPYTNRYHAGGGVYRLCYSPYR